MVTNRLFYDIASFLETAYNGGVINEESYSSLNSFLLDKKIRPVWWKYGNYDAYLNSDEWKELRGRRLLCDNYECQICGAKNNLRVHHITYEKESESPEENLVTLCNDCHLKVHQVVDEFKTTHYAVKNNCYKETEVALAKVITDIINNKFGFLSKKHNAVRIIRDTIGEREERFFSAFDYSYVMQHLLKKTQKF